MIAVVGGFAASATVFSYMFTFVILAVIAELFGRNAAKTVINVGLFGLVVSVLFFMLAIYAPPASFWNGQASYETTLGSAPRILLGGWTAYLVAQHLDIFSFFFIKKRKPGKNSLWLRAVGGMLIGQLIDTIIFISIAFYGEFPIGPAITGQYLLKVALAVISAPIIHYMVKWLRPIMSLSEDNEPI